MGTYYTTHNAGGGGDGSFGSPWTLQEAFDTAVAGDEVRILNTGTYTPSVQLDCDTNSGTITSPITYRGRNSGDTAYEMATISGASLGASTDLVGIAGGVSNLIFRDLRFTAATGANINFASGGQRRFVDCRIDSAGTYGIDGAYVVLDSFYRCEICDNGSHGVYRINGVFFGCSIHDNTGYGIESQSADVFIYYSAIYRNGNRGIWASRSMIALNSIFFNNAGDGIFWSGGAGYLATICNNIITNNTGYGIDANARPFIECYADWNCLYNNSSGAFPAGEDLGENNVTSDPLFTSTTAGSEDFSLQAGSPCLAAGFPGTVPVWSDSNDQVGYMDIGLLVRGGGGGGSSGNMSGGLQ